jgi:Mn2+/Fe2+ NRAMP family transporter
MSVPGEHEPPRRLRDALRLVGPGIVVAATGVGAGDLVAAAKAGSTYGLAVLWTVVLGAALKYALAEGVARWQLATGTPLLEGWVRFLGWPVRAYFMGYLVLWTLVVAAALMAACGLGAHALLPVLSVNQWAVVHGVAGLLLVWFEGYAVLERMMKWAVGLMFVSIVGAALLSPPAGGAALAGAMPRLPSGGVLLVAGVVGGVGGTVTLLSYGYWLQEKGWRGAEWLAAVRVDLAVAYVLTGVFGAALIMLGATVLLPAGVQVEGSAGALRMAAMLGAHFGRAGTLVFLLGFWAAVATSLLGVWQGVPYLFSHLAALMRGASPEEVVAAQSTRSPLYRGFLLFMTFPPMLLLVLHRPVWLVIAYAIVGALFMPFLAATLLALNGRRRELGRLANGPAAWLALALCLVLFAFLAVAELAHGGG